MNRWPSDRAANLPHLVRSNVSRCMCRGDLHLVKHAPNRSHQISYIFRKNAPNRADSKAFSIAHLAGIDNESEFAQLLIKNGEVKAMIARETKRGDEMALMLRREIRIEAKFRHTLHQRPPVSGVPPGSALHSAFLVQLV